MVTLLAIRSQLGSPPALRSWTLGANPCSYSDRVACSSNGTVMALILDSLGAPAPSQLPLAATALTALTMLSLSHNLGMTGTVPPEYSLLLSLRQLRLAASGAVSGPMPPQFSALTNLNALLFNDNSITGTLPPQWSRLTQLTVLSGASNQLQGSIPAAWTPSVPVSTSYLNVSLAFNPGLCGDVPSGFPLWSTAGTSLGTPCPSPPPPPSPNPVCA
jgi:hypothetical protein